MIHWTYLTLALLARLEFSRAATCRTTPNDSGFPDDTLWNSLNSSVSGRLAKVVPSALDCYQRGCSPEEFASSTWREENLHGSMLGVCLLSKTQDVEHVAE